MTTMDLEQPKSGQISNRPKVRISLEENLNVDAQKLEDVYYSKAIALN